MKVTGPSGVERWRGKRVVQSAVVADLCACGGNNARMIVAAILTGLAVRFVAEFLREFVHEYLS